MRGTEHRQGAWRQFLAPAALLLIALALAIPGSLSRSAELPPSHAVVAVSAEPEGGESPDPDAAHACDLMETLSRTDRISGGFVNVMLQLAVTLDQVSRDASSFVDWVERVLTEDGAQGLDEMLDEVAGWVAQAFGASACSEEPIEAPEPVEEPQPADAASRT